MTCLGSFRTVLVVLAAAECSWLAIASADDWPQWQGPARNAMSKETGLLATWPKEGPPLAWRIGGLGGGDSAPSISKGRIFVMGTQGGDEVVWAISEKDGKDLWSKPLGPKAQQRMPQSQEGPGCTPTVDGDKLYVLTMSGNLACLQVSDGSIVWQRSLTRDFGGSVPTWSYRESPLIDGDNVVCTPGARDANLVALNKLTGETNWKSPAPGAMPRAAGGALPSAGGGAPQNAGGGAPKRGFGGGGFGGGGFGGRGGGGGAAYASAIAVDHQGQRQYVQLTGNALVGVAASDGKFLWRYNQPANSTGINCTTPIYHDGHVLASSAYGAGGGLVKLIKEASGNIAAEEVWFTNKMQNHHGGMIIHDGCVYGANGGNGGGFLVCLDLKSGELLWDDRASGRHAPKGSIAFAEGRLYYRVEDGTMLLIEPSRKEYVERGRFMQPDRTRSPAWSHPVIANGKLYVRDQDVLFCYDIAKK